MFHRVRQEPAVSIYPFPLITITCCRENYCGTHTSLLRKHEVYDQYRKRFSTSKASHTFSENIVAKGRDDFAPKTKALLFSTPEIPSSPAIESQLILVALACRHH